MKPRLFALLLVLAFVGAVPAQTASRALLQSVTTTGAGAANQLLGLNESYMASVAGTGAISASINIEVSNNPAVGWNVLATISLSGTTSAFSGTTSAASWAYVRGNVTALSGTGAAVTLNVYP
jgi:hypothetical protein